MTIDDVIQVLKDKELEYLKTNSFSKLPGIYAFFFIGDHFPVFGDAVSKHQIIYIGKTESSQERRDSKTHFATGKTGSSTVRRSIGALLQQEYNLVPVPRNATDYMNGRHSHFKFDERSENTITHWMQQNLALSFFEFHRPKEEIDHLETEVIRRLTPILNISNNLGNPFRINIQALRNRCASMAFGKKTTFATTSPIINFETISPSTSKFNPMATSGKYTGLWAKQLDLIRTKVRIADPKQSIQLNRNEFMSVGNRKDYSFNLEFHNGAVSNNISGSAVARDLAETLVNSAEIREILITGNFKFNMDKAFCLWIHRM